MACEHKFIPRYSEELADIELVNVPLHISDDPGKFRKYFILQKYIHDVCVLCGRVAK